MLSGNLIRVSHRKDAITPKFLNVDDPALLDLAEQLLLIFRGAEQTRLADLEESLEAIDSSGPTQLIQKGLAKVLLDRCEFNVGSTLDPEAVREKLFLKSNEAMQKPGWSPEAAKHRDPILNEVAAELGVGVAEVEMSMHADLKSEQLLIRFDDLSPVRLLHRYNVALVQALLCRTTRLECWLRKVNAARSRLLARAAKFHRLIAVWQQPSPDFLHVVLDGPLSLFSQTQKYGMQLSNFFPHVLHCSQWELSAHLLWGPEKQPKTMALNQSYGLVSHTADYASHKPSELEVFEKSFAKHSADWNLIIEPPPLTLDEEVWFPDYILVHKKSKTQIPIEILGFWRRTDLAALHRKLSKNVAGPFLLVVGEDRLVDAGEQEVSLERIVTFKRTPNAVAVIKAAEELCKSK